MILKILKLHSPKGSCNFENFQNHSYLLITNCTRGRAISFTNCTPLGPVTIARSMSPSQGDMFLQASAITYHSVERNNDYCNLSISQLPTVSQTAITIQKPFEWKILTECFVLAPLCFRLLRNVASLLNFKLFGSFAISKFWFRLLVLGCWVLPSCSSGFLGGA